MCVFLLLGDATRGEATGAESAWRLLLCKEKGPEIAPVISGVRPRHHGIDSSFRLWARVVFLSFHVACHRVSLVACHRLSLSFWLLPVLSAERAPNSSRDPSSAPPRARAASTFSLFRPSCVVLYMILLHRCVTTAGAFTKKKSPTWGRDGEVSSVFFRGAHSRTHGTCGMEWREVSNMCRYGGTRKNIMACRSVSVCRFLGYLTRTLFPLQRRRKRLGCLLLTQPTTQRAHVSRVATAQHTTSAQQ